MSKRALGVTLVLLGAVVLGISILADPLGLGAQPGVFGWKQLLGSGGGVIVVLVGILLILTGRPGQGG